MTHNDFPWRPPLQENWAALRTEAVALLDEMEGSPETAARNGPRLAELAHRLAGQRLGPMEQLQLEKLACRLWPFRAHLTPLRPLTVGLIANCTLDFMALPLRAAGLARLLLIEPIVAPIGSAAAIAHGRVDAFDGVNLDIACLWQDAAAFRAPPMLLDASAEDLSIKLAREHLRALADGIRQATGAQIVIPTLPTTPSAQIASADIAIVGAARRFEDCLNKIVCDGAAEGRWMVWDVSALAAETGHGRWFDAARFFAAKTPFALELNPLVCDHLARLFAAFAGKSRRALVLDLDNTLWGGVIGEDGLAGIRLGQGDSQGEAFLAVQALAKELRRRGVVLSICSKNDDAIARLPFREHPDMLLKENDIAVFQAGWEDKATAVNAIAETLRLGLESVVFVDDNPAERARVRQALPFVAVPELGGEPALYPAIITASGAFEHLALNKEDIHRAASYQADANRTEIRNAIGDYNEYLRSLGMRMQIAPFDEIGLPRIAQLIGKSSQFNFTTRRHSREALQAMMADNKLLCWQARLADVYGDHGMIGVLIIRKYSKDWVIDTWLQSCRILERGVEHALMNALMRTAAAESAKRVFAQFRPTARNGMLNGLFGTLGLGPSSAPRSRSKSYEYDGEWFVAATADFQPLPNAISLDLPASDDRKLGVA